MAGFYSRGDPEIVGDPERDITRDDAPCHSGNPVLAFILLANNWLCANNPGAPFKLERPPGPPAKDGSGAGQLQHA